MTLAASLPAHLLAFAAALRAAGLQVGPAETQGMLAVLGQVDLADRQECFWALRMLLCRSPQQVAAFAPIFDAFFGPGMRAKPSVSFHLMQPPLRKHQAVRQHLLGWSSPTAEAELQQVPGDSADELLRQRDLAHLHAPDDPEVQATVHRIARRLASRLGRRTRLARRGRRVALRASLRRSIGLGGELARLWRLQRQPRRQRLVVAADVSGSMALYSRFLFQVMHALHRHVAGVESFAFSTRLVRVTDPLRHGEYATALVRAGADRAFGSGTRIGQSLWALTKEYGRYLGKRTVLVILSDGLDAGEPRHLTRALRTLRDRTSRIVWLNPLAGHPGYKPAARGMAAALPFVDLFAPGHNLAALAKLPDLLAERGHPGHA